jgi:hypothetical protein
MIHLVFSDSGCSLHNSPPAGYVRSIAVSKEKAGAEAHALGLRMLHDCSS